MFKDREKIVNKKTFVNITKGGGVMLVTHW